MSKIIVLLLASSLFAGSALAETMTGSCTGGERGNGCEQSESSCLSFAEAQAEKYAGEHCQRANGSTTLYHVERFYENVSPRYEGSKKIYWCTVGFRYSCRY